MEVNFDGIVGPTHNYAGLSWGNLASTSHAEQHSNPKAAALQGLGKMKLLMNMGFQQGFFPPQERPNIALLRGLGFCGEDHNVLMQAYKTAPKLLEASFSASSMWAANMATVSPAADTQDHKLHITASNLVTYLHRAQEAAFSYQILKKIFYDEALFSVHKPLFSSNALSDEGAANHLRVCEAYSQPGVEIFVFGRSIHHKTLPSYYPARQSKEAFEAIARNHKLDTDKILFVKQNVQAIDQGVFHNDVVSVSNQNVVLYHELAFDETKKVVSELQKRCDFELHCIAVQEDELSLQDCISSYLFNSQILTKPNGAMLMLAPKESRENEAAFAVIQRILAEKNPIDQVEFIDCRQSMKNGGGPGCLRLRVVLTPEQLQNTAPSFYLNEQIVQSLEQWINKYYRDKLSLGDFLDKELLIESREALDTLTQILKLGSIYDFQK